MRWIDVFIIGAYLCCLVGVGLYFARRQKSTEAYFVAERSIPGWAMGMHLPRVHIVSSPSLRKTVSAIANKLSSAGCTVSVDTTVVSEPTIAMFEAATAKARGAEATCILGIGGGSVLDVAKLVAAFVDIKRSTRHLELGFCMDRRCHLVCMPTTSGTGSEVSPNAILLDEKVS